MRYLCCDERRRDAVRDTGLGNGIDFLEVVDGPDAPPAQRQRVLRVHFVNAPDATLRALAADEVHITGGERVRGIVAVAPLAWDGDVLTVEVSSPGDFSTYTLHIGEPGGRPAGGLDPLLDAVDFSFKAECPSEFDCLDVENCPTEPDDEPEIDYLARDYASFRQLILDRLSVTAPQWRERNPADLGVALVEVLAYAADHVSYTLDAVGMESTLATARLRPSVRRHARLVDYRVREGSNARTWVQVRVADDAGSVTLPYRTALLTQVAGVPRILTDPSPELTRALNARPVVFETMEERTLHESLNEVTFYAWGERECCLPAGATSASLRGRYEELRAGDVLVLLETRGPRTGDEAAADPARRHVVRLTQDPTFTTDPLGSWFDDPLAPLTPVDVTDVVWGREDALPFPLCISSVDDAGRYHPDVSRALGNIVLADHGLSVATDLPPVPASDERLTFPSQGSSGTRCEPARPEGRPARFSPELPHPHVTRTGTTGRALPGGHPRRPARFDPQASAAATLRWEDRHVLPHVLLLESGTGRRWDPRPDLLASGAFAPEFVVEDRGDGSARLRFGDGEHGLLPRPGTVLTAHYRTGAGSAGNIGADSLWHVVTDVAGIASVRNPLPARGGTDPEPLDRLRQDAPVAFRRQERAVTPADYAEVAGRHPEVQRAVCTERWTGTWYTMFLTVDRVGGLPVDAAFEAALRAHLERFRMAGHDLEIDGPRFVALELVLRVCVLPDYYRSDVASEVLAVLGNRRFDDGAPQLFHPDTLTFASSVHLSAVLAAVQGVEGVRYVEPLAFRRVGEPRSDAVASGVLTTGRLEIPRLDNDPNFPERGTLRLQLEGGR